MVISLLLRAAPWLMWILIIQLSTRMQKQSPIRVPSWVTALRIMNWTSWSQKIRTENVMQCLTLPSAHPRLLAAPIAITPAENGAALHHPPVAIRPFAQQESSFASYTVQTSRLQRVAPAETANRQSQSGNRSASARRDCCASTLFSVCFCVTISLAPFSHSAR